jgi:hypothetical protein
MLTDGSMVDKQMTEILDVSVDEVRNPRKMLLRIGGIRQVGMVMSGESHEEKEDLQDA